MWRAAGPRAPPRRRCVGRVEVTQRMCGVVQMRKGKILRGWGRRQYRCCELGPLKRKIASGRILHSTLPGPRPSSKQHQRSGRDGRTPFGARLRAGPFSSPIIPGTGDPLLNPITSPGSDYPRGRGAAIAASSRWGKCPVSHFQPVPVGTQHVWMFGHNFYVFCVTPPKRRLQPIRRGYRSHTGPAGMPSHSPPPPPGGSPKCMGRGEPCQGPRGAGKRRAPTPRDRSVPSRGVSGHPGAARSLPLLPFSRWVGFYVEGGTRHPPPGPTTPTGKPSRGISMGKSTPHDVGGPLGVREPAQATPRTPQVILL